MRAVLMMALALPLLPLLRSPQLLLSLVDSTHAGPASILQAAFGGRHAAPRIAPSPQPRRSPRILGSKRLRSSAMRI